MSDIFGFADQEKITYGLGYTLTLKRNNNNDPIIRDNGVDAAKINIKDISWYIPHYVPSLENQQLVMDQILDKDPTEIFYTERTVFRKDVNTNNNWTFELGNSGESAPTFVVVAFQARNKIDSQTHDNAIFDRLPVSNAVCKIGSEKYPDDGIEFLEFLEKKKEIIFDAAKLVEEQQTILRNHFERNLISDLEKCKNQAVKDTIQLLYNKGLFDSFENKDQIFQSYLNFTDEYLLEKYGTEMKTSDGVYYLSDLDYSTREDILNCLKIDEYKDIVDLKYRMKLTDTDINFILFEN